jgi:phage/plasmid-associated DNA primase
MVTARFMRAEFFTFRPSLKLWLATNHRPEIRGTDYAMWRRIRLIPFTVKIPEGKEDKTIEKQLEAELAGILAWAVRGCLDWQRDGLTKPKEVTEATREYQEDMDVLGGFLRDYCLIDAKAHCGATPLYNAYKEWCDSNGEHILSQQKFGRRVRERPEGFRSERNSTSGLLEWWGVGLRSDPSGPPEPSEPSEEDFRVDAHEGDVRESMLKTGSEGSEGSVGWPKCSAAYPPEPCPECGKHRPAQRKDGTGWACRECYRAEVN